MEESPEEEMSMSQINNASSSVTSRKRAGNSSVSPEQVKKRRVFPVAEFKMEIQNPSTVVKALQDFLSAYQEHLPDNGEYFFAHYFSQGGTITDIVNLLPTTPQGAQNPVLVPALCILDKMLSFLAKSTANEEGQKACMKVITCPDVKELLQSPNVKRRCLVISLLAAAFEYGQSFTKDVLSNFPIEATSALIKNAENREQIKPLVHCYCVMVQTYLRTANSYLINTFSTKKDFLTCFVKHLPHMKCVSVVKYLDLLRQKLVENSEVLKTAKMSIFNTHVLTSLLDLYGWKGVWKDSQKKPDDYQEKRLSVHKSLDPLMLSLCTNFKYGVIFRDEMFGFGGKSKNELLRSIMPKFGNFWEKNLRSELLQKILTTCPDVLSHFLNLVHADLEPVDSDKWHKIVKFLIQVFGSLKVTTWLKHSSFEKGKVSLAFVEHVLMNFVMPRTCLQSLKLTKLGQLKCSMKCRVISLLLAILKNLQGFISEMSQRRLLSADDQGLVKELLEKEMFSLFPSSTVLMTVWKECVNMCRSGEVAKETITLENGSDTLEGLLDLMNFYKKFCYPLLDTGVFNPQDLISDISDVLSGGDVYSSPYIVKAFHLMVSTNREIFVPTEANFKYALITLLKLLNVSAGVNKLLARNSLYDLLLGSRVFEGNPAEVIFWIFSYYTLPESKRDVVTEVFASAVVKCAHRPAKYMDMVTAAAEKASSSYDAVAPDAYDASIFEDLLTSLDSVSLETNLNNMDSRIFATGFGPLLPAVLKVADKKFDGVDKPKEVVDFISKVVIFLLHTQISPETMFHLVSPWSHLIRSSVIRYVSGWLPNSNPAPLKAPFGKDSFEHKLSKGILLSGNEMCSEVVDSLLALNPRASDDEEGLAESTPTDFVSDTEDPVRTLHLFNLTLYHFCHLISTGEMKKHAGENSIFCMSVLLTKFFHTNFSHDLQSKLHTYCLARVYTHPVLISNFANFSEEHFIGNHCTTLFIRDFTKFAINASKVCSTEISSFIKPFKHKLISSYLKLIKKNKRKDKPFEGNDQHLNLLLYFKCDQDDLLPVLNKLVCFLPLYVLLRKEVADVKIHFSFFGNLLLFLLNDCPMIYRNTKDENIALPDATVSSILKILLALENNESVDVAPLEECCLRYLQMFPHHLALVSEVLLKSMVERPDLSSAGIKLILFIAKRDETKAEMLLEWCKTRPHIKVIPQLVFPLITVFLSHDSLPSDDEFYSLIFDLYEKDFRSAIINPNESPDWLQNNIEAVVSIMNRSRCDFEQQYTAIIRDIKKYDDYKFFHVKLLECVFYKAKSALIGGDMAVVNFVEICLRMFVKLIENCDFTNLENLAQVIIDWTNSSKVDEKFWNSFKKGSVWLTFTRDSLKHGIDTNKPPVLLTVLSHLCNVLYKDAGREGHMEHLFDITLSHSEFFKVMFESSPVKEKLVNLLYVVVTKAPVAMQSTHVPVILGAYGATLSNTDQLLLKVLSLYEDRGVNTNNLRPYLWGQAAINHYSVHSKYTVALWNTPTTLKVMNNFDKVMMENTVKNFPLTRLLDASSQMHAPRDDIYDPSFYLNLFSEILAVESLVNPVLFHRSGCLAMTIAAMSSNCTQIRMSAYHVLFRFYKQMSAAHNVSDKSVWVHFILALGKGAKNISHDLFDVRISSIVTKFLARASLCISEPGNPLYETLLNYITVKPVLDLTQVPEFHIMIRNSGVYSDIHRKFILEAILDGMLQSVDFNLVHQHMVMKQLMMILLSCVSDCKTKVTILEIFQRIARIPSGATQLVQDYGILGLIKMFIESTKDFGAEIAAHCLSLLLILWDTIRGHFIHNASVFNKLRNVGNRIFAIIISNIDKFTKDAKSADLCALLYGLNTLLQHELDVREKSIVSLNILRHIIRVGDKQFGPGSGCTELLRYGYEYADLDSDESSAKSDLELARERMRWLVVKWLKLMNQKCVPI